MDYQDLLPDPKDTTNFLFQEAEECHWIQGNTLVSTRYGKLGWTEVSVRRPTGTSVWLIQLKNLPRRSNERQYYPSSFSPTHTFVGKFLKLLLILLIIITKFFLKNHSPIPFPINHNHWLLLSSLVKIQMRFQDDQVPILLLVLLFLRASLINILTSLHLLLQFPRRILDLFSLLLHQQNLKQRPMATK